MSSCCLTAARAMHDLAGAVQMDGAGLGSAAAAAAAAAALPARLPAPRSLHLGDVQKCVDQLALSVPLFFPIIAPFFRGFIH